MLKARALIGSPAMSADCMRASVGYIFLKLALTRFLTWVTLAETLFLTIRSVAFRMCMQQFPDHWYELRYFTRISNMWLSNSQFLNNWFQISSVVPVYNITVYFYDNPTQMNFKAYQSSRCNKRPVYENGRTKIILVSAFFRCGRRMISKSDDFWQP